MKKLNIQNTIYQQLEKGFQEWLKTLGYKNATQKIMSSCVREFLYNMEQSNYTQLDEIGPSEIIRHYEYLQNRPNQRQPGGLSESVISKHIQAIKWLFHYQEQMQKIKKNPMSGLYFPSPKSKTTKTLSQQEIEELYHSARNFKDSALLGAFYGCGLRRSEAEKLTINDINYQAQRLYVREGKGKKRRVIPMSSRVVEDFENYYYHERKGKINEHAFFLNKKGTRMRDQSFAVWFRKQKVKAGIEKASGLHGLRHSIATHLLENGVKVEYVRDFLGHEFLETTKIYTRVNKKQLTTNF